MTTDTPIAEQAAAATGGNVTIPQQGTQPQRLTFLGHLHHDLSLIGQATEHAWPIIRAAVTNPLIDELVEAALTADGLGVEAQAFQAAIDALNGASTRKAQPQPVTVAPAAPE
jgi:hypothetical protein